MRTMVHQIGNREARKKGAAAGRVICACIAILFFSGCRFPIFPHKSATEQTSAQRSRLGINLSSPADWGTELPFVDIFRFSRAWISMQEGADWGMGPPLDLDEHGWVKSLDAGCWAETVLCSGGHYPEGQYVLLYDGEGTLELNNVSRIVSAEPGRIVFIPDPSLGAFYLRINTTTPGNYVKNIRILMPGFETSYEANPFNPVFLERWKNMHVLRFMDWMQTNGSATREWSERPDTDDATWSDKGVPVEVLVDLANRLGADPWFCMPHEASDDYVRNFAETVAARLDPSLKAYIEYSNELWNPAFPQYNYVNQKGLQLGFGTEEYLWEAGWRYASYRSVQIFKLWEEAFGGTDRLVRVMGSQSACAYVSDVKLSFQNAYLDCDVLAIAPYMTLCVSNETTPSTATVAGWTVDQVLDYVEQTALPDAISWTKASKAIADQYKVDLVAYEAGQHLVGVVGGENNDEMTNLFLAANRSERMGRIYETYLDAWRDEGGGICTLFTSVCCWSKWGSWGLLENNDDDTAKYRAVVAWNAENMIQD